MTAQWPDPPKFDIKYDIYGRGEPKVALVKPGTMTEAARISLSEAEQKGVVTREQAEHARAVNERIRRLVQKGAERVKAH